MKTNNRKILPGRAGRITLRILIILGLISIVNFFYWFVQPELIANQLLFWLLIGPIVYDCLRILYIWYHYWDISVPLKPKSTKKFTVDVLTTYFPGEPRSMVKDTLRAIKRMNYPHTTYLCDEANDPELIEFCRQHDVVHLTRNNRIDAKAGNINNALKQATGDICLILDPDHVPKENFLDEVVPYFEDEKIGFVQTVQGYYNVKESQVAQGAAEQTFQFYGPLMMSMNSYGTVNAIGANCIFRRKALDSIGGHAAGLSEDMHTSMQLHAKGWQSVYVPETFTKGLVPSTITAYYKQQLKWSRGTLDLLVNTYPRLFRNFTLRQKIHYGLLPLHYMAGFAIFLSFLIPILALFTATIPWRGNVINFGLMVLPVFTCVLGIRFYVQQWLADKSERGMHILGGVLLACTWWIFMIGALYTVIRKRVPYLPTPKDDKETTSWKILIPNLVVGVVSLIAVVYGLTIDLTPFTLFMSGFALLNALLMFYSFYLAYEKQRPVDFSFDYEPRTTALTAAIQHHFYKIWNMGALPITFLIIVMLGGIYYQTEYVKWLGVKPEKQNKNSLTYIGIFAPQTNNGITNLKDVNKITREIGENFDIVSLYMAWGKDAESNFPQEVIDSIYRQRSIPMITWEPWINMHQDDPYVKGKHVFELIDEGYFDSFIASFANRLKNLQKPIYLRFAHEFDNPMYPWFVEIENGADRFKKAWVHAYEIFKDQGAVNVIWIWNPWKSASVASFYPGKDYVDWFGVNMLNYGSLNQDATWHDFKNLYKPFHDEFRKLPLTPVMISEFGTLREEPRQAQWIYDAFNSIENEFTEIKSLIYFHSNIDNNLPEHAIVNVNLDWTIPGKVPMRKGFERINIPDYLFSDLPYIKTYHTAPRNENFFTLKNFRGINIKTSKDWRQEYLVMNRKKLFSDFKKMKEIGFNTVNFVGNTVYEYNILNASEAIELDVVYGFWVPEEIDFVLDAHKAEKLKNDILKKVAERKNLSHIVAWHIQNDVLYRQKDYFLKPRLLYQNNAFILWLQDLVSEIKRVDDQRPVIVDIEVNLLSVYHSRMLLSNVTGIDYLGLVVKEENYLGRFERYLESTGVNFIYSKIGADLFLKSESPWSNIPFFIADWQDQHESNKLSFDGLIDRKGRERTSYYNLGHTLQKTEKTEHFPDVRILKPSVLINEGRIATYHAMVYEENEGWRLGSETSGFTFEWALVKCDVYGNPLAIKDVGHGDRLHLKIPGDYEYFKLLLTVSNGKSIETTLSTLHTPLEIQTRG